MGNTPTHLPAEIRKRKSLVGHIAVAPTTRPHPTNEKAAALGRSVTASIRLRVPRAKGFLPYHQEKDLLLCQHNQKRKLYLTTRCCNEWRRHRRKPQANTNRRPILCSIN
jgi:hypothetical protein